MEARMSKPRLFEQVRDQMRLHHYSLRTEETYLHWIKRYILFHGKRHPAEMGEQEITAFLTHLAVDKNVAASTQNQALAAVLFLCKHDRLASLKLFSPTYRPAAPWAGCIRLILDKTACVSRRPR
jgi:hypothetical protein